MINIQDIIPFMKKGWVAMDEDGDWYWYPLVPDTGFNGEWRCNAVQSTYTLKAFDIAPADDWTKSLIKVDGK
jgi:hypothetical protein